MKNITTIDGLNLKMMETSIKYLFAWLLHSHFNMFAPVNFATFYKKPSICTNIQSNTRIENACYSIEMHSTENDSAVHSRVPIKT